MSLTTILDLNPCKDCGREPEVGIYLSEGVVIICKKCKTETKPVESMSVAVKKWNEENGQTSV